jgi:MinD-like ATPase involved in chromosome partitioning or flagellar assembly
MTTPVLVALEGSPAEEPLVAAFGRPTAGVNVVRRCVDVAELLAAAASGSAKAALVSADLRRLDGSVVARLAASGVGVVGLAGVEEDERRLRAIGVALVLASDAAPSAVAAALTRSATTTVRGGLAAEFADPADALELLRNAGLEEDGAATDASPGEMAGRVVAVWGPTGAPGRTLLATTLAAEAALLGVPTLLVDADTYGGAVAPMLGLLDDAPGLAAAARAANLGTLDVASLAGHARAIRLDRAAPLRVLTGLTRADRWPEIRPTAVERVLELARRLCPLVVVDCGFCLETDEELSYDSVAPRRNGVTLTVLAAADRVLAVGSADPVGLARLVRELPDLAIAAPGARRSVVVNRLRDGAVSGDPASEVTAALRRFAGVTTPILLPEDRAAADAALVAGRTVGEVAPRSAYRLAVRALAASVSGTPAPRATRRRVRTLAG